jgi:hypothetical protein
MQVKMIYSESQLDATADFLSKNNKHFRGQYIHIRQSILDTIKEMAVAAKPGNNMHMSGTMGYIVSIDNIELESIDDDENSILVEILIDPAIGCRNWDDDDYKEFVVDVPLQEPTILGIDYAVPGVPSAS